jgi:hypothetical protein
VTLACVWAAACGVGAWRAQAHGLSSRSSEGGYVSGPARGAYVRLVPDLEGGAVGLCMATGVEAAYGGGGSCGAPPTSTGPVFAETCEVDESVSYTGAPRVGRRSSVTIVYALVRAEVAAVSVAGGSPVATHTNPTLPEGLRAVAVELHTRLGRFQRRRELRCPHLTPLDAELRPIPQRGEPSAPLERRLPAKLWWRPERGSALLCARRRDTPRSACRIPRHPQSGACRLTMSRPIAGLSARAGSVAGKIRPIRGLLSGAFLSCINAEYRSREGVLFDAAVLLDAAKPGVPPAALPAMKRLAGHEDVFDAPGWSGKIFARRLADAWLVVETPGEEEDGSVKVALRLLQRLHAAIRL